MVRQQTLGEAFENPQVPKNVMDLADKYRDAFRRRTELQQNESELKDKIKEAINNIEDESTRDELKKTGFIVDCEGERVHFTIQRGEEKIKMKKLKPESE